MIKYTAHAKLNLYLQVTGIREDGYHLLDSLFVFTTFGDEISLSESDSLSLTANGPFATALLNESHTDNLAYRAADLLQKTYLVKRGAKITLTKNIPVSAGLGGGSSDAATVLRGLNSLWQLDLPMSTLETLAVQLGADVPACLYQSPLLVSGIGEQITPAILPSTKYFVVLVNPNLPLSTASVFRALNFSTQNTPAKNNVSALPTDGDAFLTFLGNKANDLTLPAIQQLPVIQTILASLSSDSHCLLARLSGSGPTCFGLFKTETDAIKASQHIQKMHPSFWTHATDLLK